MMKTALSIIQATRRKMGLSVPTAVVGATDPDELQMIAVLYDVLEQLRASRCWPQQKRKFSFTTTASRSQYQLPADFYSALPKTHWNTTEDLRLLGPLGDDEFGGLLYGGEPSSVNFSFRVFGWDESTASTSGQIELSPTPSSEIACSFEYISRNLLLPRHWAASTAFAASAYCNASGHVYTTSAGGTTGATIPSHTSGSASDGVVTWAYSAAAYETIVADTDLVIFDDDVVKLGLEAGLVQQYGGDFQPVQVEFLSRINQAKSRMTSPSVGSFCDARRGPRYWTPYKSWSL